MFSFNFLEISFFFLTVSKNAKSFRKLVKIWCQACIINFYTGNSAALNSRTDGQQEQEHMKKKPTKKTRRIKTRQIQVKKYSSQPQTNERTKKKAPAAEKKIKVKVVKQHQREREWQTAKKQKKKRRRKKCNVFKGDTTYSGTKWHKNLTKRKNKPDKL